MRVIIWVIITVDLLKITLGRKGFGPTDQEWGYVDVRKNCHMFWWLHYTTANVSKVTDRPLVVWLQGGPCASSTGEGNFDEIGPLDRDLKERKTSWVKDVNLLFVDNPVGSGFSYVNCGLHECPYATSNKQIAIDFLIMMEQFYKKFPQFQDVPLYILGEAYGGKMVTDIALVLHQKKAAGKIRCNLQGIGLGNPWISPEDSILSWSTYLNNLGTLDTEGVSVVDGIVDKFKQVFRKGIYRTALDYWYEALEEIELWTCSIDFFNVLVKVRSIAEPTRRNLDSLMNGEVRTALNISFLWGPQSYPCLRALANDYVRPVVDVLEELLNSTHIKVSVYSGQLDLRANIVGLEHWVEKMNWKNKGSWKAVDRIPFAVDGYYEGYVKKSGNFALYWVNRAGQRVPSENSGAMGYILKELTNNYMV
ncbi:unnamed protein product [Callosobruchus maculatus]|uniref:Carboxypeptidase n=1 Tax=Callosobruchus maculatus TaxID=64391 RepID=A0A653DK39_CALMS|nr:unnamed protein product [Callosobruchus maculatus]